MSSIKHHPTPTNLLNSRESTLPELKNLSQNVPFNCGSRRVLNLLSIRAMLVISPSAGRATGCGTNSGALASNAREPDLKKRVSMILFQLPCFKNEAEVTSRNWMKFARMNSVYCPYTAVTFNAAKHGMEPGNGLLPACSPSTNSCKGAERAHALPMSGC